MQREIKFRGKSAGHWVYGSLVFSAKENAYYIVEHQGDELSYFIEDNATIGQYTGLKDKNGKEIYGGNIIEAIYGNRFEVFWSEKELRWETRNDIEINGQLTGKVEPEIIGNIYNNPELLRGGYRNISENHTGGSAQIGGNGSGGTGMGGGSGLKYE